MVVKYIKKLALISVVIGFMSACVGVDPQGRGYSVAIPMGIINSTLAQSFPVQEKVSYGLVSGTLNVESPNVLGQSGSDKLGVGTSFKFTNFLIPDGIKGTIDLASGVRYDANSKNLYLANPMVNEIKFQDFSLAKHLTPDMRNAIGMIIAEAIAKKPIYNLTKSGNMATGLVQGIDVRNGQVFVTFGL
ncbi:MAG TPA: DUF1439 domain-containing protein [Campylobacterales bacterium]|nr:DUF1439 domain-containing protein [Campylobacterales bacterium]